MMFFSTLVSMLCCVSIYFGVVNDLSTPLCAMEIKDLFYYIFGLDNFLTMNCDSIADSSSLN